MTDSRKKLFIKTFGCQMNVYDSERMADVLAPHGYDATSSPEDADLVILNTCHIREKAAEKVYSEIGRLRRHKQRRQQEGHEALIAVAGCVAQAEGEEIARRAGAVDLVFGPQAYHRLPELLDRARDGQPRQGLTGGNYMRRGRAIVDTSFPEEDKFDHLPQRPAARGAHAFLTVQEGCDKFCTFCVVPYTRGMESSRPAAAILEEARRMADAGVREITLLGQNVNAYHGAGNHGGNVTLAGLIDRLAGIDGIERLRYTTSHPRDMSDDLIAAHRDQPKLMPYLHLPVQAGSDRILAAMNRKHTGEHYLAIIDRLRRARPDIALSGDFIVGFPGETDADFEATLAIVRKARYAQAYSFKYSARPGTPAADMDDQVPEPAKRERLAALQALIGEQQDAFNRACIGRTLPVLLDRQGRKDGQLAGRSPYLQAVQVDAAPDLAGTIQPVIVEGVGGHSLFGRLARDGERRPDGYAHPPRKAHPPKEGPRP